MAELKSWSPVRQFGAGLMLVPVAGMAIAGGPATPEPDLASRTVDELRLEMAPNERWIRIPGTTGVVRTWNERRSDGEFTPMYAISRDGRSIDVVRETSYDLALRYASFDPLKSTPTLRPELAAPANNEIFIVQFVTQPLNEFRVEIERAGGRIHRFLANHSLIVQLDESAREQVAAMPFVRWVGAYHPAYKLDEGVRQELFPTEDYAANGMAGAADAPVANVFGADRKASFAGPISYYIQVFERGARQKLIVADHIRAAGGRVDILDPNGFLIVATLNAQQLARVLSLNEVVWVDLWGPPEDDMDIAREISGANFIETTLGFTGEGVRAEVMDGNVRGSHVDFQNPPVLFHGSTSGDASHGTPTYGINFGDGTGNAMGRGILPDAEAKIFSDYDPIYNGQSSRYTHTEEIVDPNGQFRGVFQSNSWGNPRTRSYTNISMEMDDIIFLNDVTITQSQSNAGNQDSRPQAWAKNIVSVGGVYHRNTLSRTDDGWSFGGSTGPASDGRIKPDFTHFYDNIFTTYSSSDTSYTTSFGGTSGATPITAGHFGLVYQMWHEGVFDGFGGGPGVFEDKPHFTTAKALLINSTYQYGFPPATDMDRFKQGWGMVNVQTLYENSDRMLVIDESEVIENLETWSIDVNVEAGEPALKATMVYADLPGNVSSQIHRINDLTLKLTSPTGVEYWGNNGLTDGHWSTSGGSANTLDTVENVFVQNPEAGWWTIDVIGSEIVEDAHVETGAVDADFALVVSGIIDSGGGDELQLQVSDLIRGLWGTATILNCTPGELVHVFYSRIGLGATFVPDLNVTLDLERPVLAATSVSDRNGRAVASRAIAADVRVGTDLWIQAAQYERLSNIVETEILDH